jgi:hypothetical protein
MTTTTTDANTSTKRAKADATSNAAGSLFVAVLGMALSFLLPTDIVQQGRARDLRRRRRVGGLAGAHSGWRP